MVPALFWDESAILPIEVEPPLTPTRATAVLALSQQYGLIVNGGANLESARGEGVSITPASGVK